MATVVTFKAYVTVLLVGCHVAILLLIYSFPKQLLADSTCDHTDMTASHHVFIKVDRTPPSNIRVQPSTH